MTSILYMTKLIFHFNPTIEVFHVTFLKAVISMVILLISINVNLKNVCWDSVDPRSIGALTFKSFQSMISILISYNAMKYFSVSLTSVVCNLSPFSALFLAFWLLGENIRCWNIFAVFIIFASVCLVVLGA